MCVCRIREDPHENTTYYSELFTFRSMRRASPWNRSLSICLYQFPAVAVIKHHKLDGLKQQNFLILQFCRGGRGGGGRGARGGGERESLKSKCWQGMLSCRIILLYFWCLPTIWHSLTLICITPISAFILTRPSPCRISVFTCHLLIRKMVTLD